MFPKTAIRLIPPSRDEAADCAASPPALVPGQLTGDDLDAARQLAELHQGIAADLPVHSPIRALALRSGGHWGRLGGLPRQGLKRVPPPE